MINEHDEWQTINANANMQHWENMGKSLQQRVTSSVTVSNSLAEPRRPRKATVRWLIIIDSRVQVIGTLLETKNRIQIKVQQRMDRPFERINAFIKNKIKNVASTRWKKKMHSCDL